ncbi:MAG: matrixin family metalloprotease [Candidatus Pacebacteria bacterium]|nr:matrixin family metalloprotease [Candidatus Paceibacterota bacterium]
MKHIEIVPYCDEKFERSSWNFEIRKELETALGVIEKQFDIRFSVLETRKWNSPYPDDMAIYPEGIVRTLEGDDIPHSLAREALKLGLIGGDDSVEIEREMNDVLKKEGSIMYMLGFFSGRISSFQQKGMLDSLEKLHMNKNGIAIGFTGKKFCLTSADIRTALGWTSNGSNCAVIGISPKKEIIIKVIIHEMGHILGAGHSDDTDSIMFENALKITSLMFDEQNRKLIEKNIKKL